MNANKKREAGQRAFPKDAKPALRLVRPASECSTADLVLSTVAASLARTPAIPLALSAERLRTPPKPTPTETSSGEGAQGITGADAKTTVLLAPFNALSGPG